MDKINKYWDFVNRCDVSDPVETRRRVNVAISVLDNASISIDDYNDMMDALAYIVRESYYR